jgi:hypothetical protein
MHGGGARPIHWSYWYKRPDLRIRDHQGLNVFRLDDRLVKSAILPGHLNPQTQELALGRYGHRHDD